MSSTLERLIYAANQIARNLATHHDPEAAVADHLASFWDPRMKTMIFGHVEAGASGLDAIATAAVRRLRSDGAPPHQTPATTFNAVDEAGGSDAG